MLDVYGYKSTAEDTKQFDSLAREILHQETGQDNLNALIGQDQNGNLWIYASEEAKLFAESRSQSRTESPQRPLSPAHATAESRLQIKVLTNVMAEEEGRISRAESEPVIPAVEKAKRDDGYAYAKTLRLSSEQLVHLLFRRLTSEKSLNLKPGKNSLSFSVTSSFAGKATCNASMFYWKYDVPVVISDIDGTITKYSLPPLSWVQ